MPSGEYETATFYLPSGILDDSDDESTRKPMFKPNFPDPFSFFECEWPSWSQSIPR